MRQDSEGQGFRTPAPQAIFLVLLVKGPKEDDDKQPGEVYTLPQAQLIW